MNGIPERPQHIIKYGIVEGIIRYCVERFVVVVNFYGKKVVSDQKVVVQLFTKVGNERFILCPFTVKQGNIQVSGKGLSKLTICNCTSLNKDMADIPAKVLLQIKGLAEILFFQTVTILENLT